MMAWRPLNKAKIIAVALVLTMAALIVVLAIDLIPMLKDVVNHVRDEKSVVSKIHGLGVEGVLILIALQALQIITVIFPSIAVQILAGLTYGVFGGLLICLAGYLIGNTVIFVLMRQLHNAFKTDVPLPIRTHRKSGWDFSFIREARNATILAFFLFLIPGVPNGILPYIFARTKISLRNYLLCILVAATPTIVLSSTVGSRIAHGDFLTAVIVVSLMVVMTLVVYFTRNRIILFLKKSGDKEKIAVSSDPNHKTRNRREK